MRTSNDKDKVKILLDFYLDFIKSLFEYDLRFYDI